MSPNARASVFGIAGKRDSPPQKAPRQQRRPVKKGRHALFQSNASRARTAWGLLPQYALQRPKELADRLSIDVAAGELRYLDGRWYVTHAGLLQIARHNRCVGQNSHRKRTLRSGRQPLGFQGEATVYSSPSLQRLRRLRRRRPLQCLLAGPWRRDARRRDPRCPAVSSADESKPIVRRFSWAEEPRLCHSSPRELPIAPSLYMYMNCHFFVRW
jgi:hypothetical protein